MKINLTAVKQANYMTPTKSSPLKQNTNYTHYKQLEQNVISVKSNSIHYRIVKEDPYINSKNVGKTTNFYFNAN